MKKNLLLLLVSLILSFAAAEIICRAKGVYLSYNERTGAGGYTSPFDIDTRSATRAYEPREKRFLKRNEFTDSFTVNEDGLKEKEASAIPPGKRILVLGDSYAEGVGAPPDSSYPRILQSLLRQSGDTSVQVINAGIGGSDVFFEYKLFEALQPKYKPDVILLTINPSDIFEVITRGGFERFKQNGEVQYRRPPWFEPLYARSLLVRLLVHDVFHYDFSFIRRRNYDAAVAHAEENMAAAIDTFAAACALRHLPLRILFHPFYTEVQQPERYGLKNLVAHCRQKNIACTDELAYLLANGINADNWTTIYWPQDGHFKPKGYELLAQCAFEMVKH